MSISISGLGSGIQFDQWITQLVALKQAKIDEVSKQVSSIETSTSTLTSLKGTYTTLQTKMQAITDARLSSTNNIFTQKTATSSATAVTASATASASVQSVKVSVSQLATATKAQSASVAGDAVDANTLLSGVAEGSLTEGKFSVYVNGTKNTIDIVSTDKVDDVLNDIRALGLNASIVDGKVSISANVGTTLSIGSNADTSNFSDVFALTKAVDSESYTSSKSIFETDTTAVITSAKFAGGSVTAGTFTIGGAEFDTTGKTLDSLILEINKSEDAGVDAYWDPNSGKLVLEADDEGAVNINIEAGTSNFTEIMGLTTAGALAAGSQTLGTNAKLTINGTEITSSSNKVTSDISGITGLTLTLNDETTSTATVDIKTDNSKVTTAIKDFVTAFNEMMSKTNIAVGKGGVLHGESILTMVQNKLRGDVMSSVVGADGYKTLASIGITTGAFSTNTEADTNKLVIDETKLAAALEADPQAVMKLLAGDSTTNEAGVLTKLNTVVTNALNPENGYFVKREASYGVETSTLNKKISKMETDLAAYKATLEAKFQAMDTLIGNLKSQASQMDQILGNTNKKEES